MGAPRPRKAETPTEFADRLTTWYASNSGEEHRKSKGQYFTPLNVARFMASLSRGRGDEMRILDAGAGTGVLSCSICEAMASRKSGPSRLEILAVEPEPRLASLLRRSLSHAKRWLASQGIELQFKVEQFDFILEFGSALSNQGSLLRPNRQFPTFDLVIGNPPYFKLRKSDPRAEAAMPVVHGQPNIYALFLAVASKLVSEKGELIFITPRSFSSGPYFRLFREKFFGEMRPDFIHTFASRKETFSRDSILQENLIFRAKKLPTWHASSRPSSITMSASNGSADLARTRRRKIPLKLILDTDTRERFLFVPACEEDDAVVRLVHSWKRSLHDFGLEISTGPVVSFRSRELLVLDPQEATVPMLVMQHVRSMKITWPISSLTKEQHILTNGEKSNSVLLPNRNYVVMRRFSAKEERRRLTAAPLMRNELPGEQVGLENHLNYIHRPNGEMTDAETWGLAGLLNSTLLDDYFRTLSGSTQVNAAEIRAMPLPDLEAIRELGDLLLIEFRGAPDGQLESSGLTITAFLASL